MEAPEFYHQTAGFSSTLDSKPKPSGGCEHFMVEDLLDFSNDDNGILAAAATTNDVVMGNGGFDALVPGGNCSTEDSSSISAGSDHPHNFNSLDAAGSSHFCNDLSVPYDDLEELEWLSNFVEESFSSEGLQKLHLISGMTTRSDESSDTPRNSQADRTATPNPCNNTISNDSNLSPIFHPEMMSVPAKARSKRSRAAPMTWASRLLVLSSSTSPPPSPSKAAPTLFPGPKILTWQPKTTGKKPSKPAAPRKRVEGGEAKGEGRKCLHCATDKTPQWRTGPMGPKTLCNACGVRYKSGRLVPEYRPAASPTFVLTKHSNSHRKVLELRRQKELLQAQQQQQHFLHRHHHQGGMVFDVSSSNGDDYLIHQHVGPDFRQLI